MKINSKSILEKVDYYIDVMLLNEKEDSENNNAKINSDDECCCKKDEDDEDHKDMQILHDEETEVDENVSPQMLSAIQKFQKTKGIANYVKDAAGKPISGGVPLNSLLKK